LCALVARRRGPFALRAVEVVRALRPAAPHARRRTLLIATLVALRRALELTVLGALTTRRRGTITLNTTDVIRAWMPAAHHTRRRALLVATLITLRGALELAALVARTARRTVALRAAAVVGALVTAAHERRRALAVAILPALRRRALDLAALVARATRRTIALSVATVIRALMTAAHERRRTLAVAILSTLRRALDISAGALLIATVVVRPLAWSAAAHPRRGRRTVALGTLGRLTLDVTALAAWRGRRTLALGAIGFVRAVMTVVHTGRRPLLVVAVVAHLLATALMRRGRRGSAGVLRRRVERREAEHQRGCCDDFLHGVCPFRFQHRSHRRRQPRRHT
jgi:hypothetical protein